MGNDLAEIHLVSGAAADGDGWEVHFTYRVTGRVDGGDRYTRTEACPTLPRQLAHESEGAA